MIIFSGAGTVSGGDPLGVPDLQLWIDAPQETGFSNGDQVATAQDFSGNNRDATGVIHITLLPTYRATDGPNGLPTFRLQNQSTVQGGYFTLPDFLSGSAGHSFVVVKLDLEENTDSRASTPLGDWGTASNVGVYQNASDGKIYSQWGSTIRRGTADPPTSLENWHVYEERTAANDWSNWLNGTMLFQTLTNTVAWNTAPKIGRCNLGGLATMYGMIAEIIFYNRVLISGEVDTIYEYLSEKYGFSL